MTAPSHQKLVRFRLVWPIFVEQLLHQLVYFVDLWMVGRIPQAQAALQQPGQVLYVAIIVFMFVGVGSSVVITHHLGAGDRSTSAGGAVAGWSTRGGASRTRTRGSRRRRRGSAGREPAERLG